MIPAPLDVLIIVSVVLVAITALISGLTMSLLSITTMDLEASALSHCMQHYAAFFYF